MYRTRVNLPLIFASLAYWRNPLNVAHSGLAVIVLFTYEGIIQYRM